MNKTPHTATPDDSTQTKIWIRDDLLAFVDEIAARDQRSRAFVVNQAITAWKKQLMRARASRAAAAR